MINSGNREMKLQSRPKFPRSHKANVYLPNFEPNIQLISLYKLLSLQTKEHKQLIFNRVVLLYLFSITVIKYLIKTSQLTTKYLPELQNVVYM